METTLEKVKHVLDYCATQEEAVIRYRVSHMILALLSDTGHLNKFNSQSIAGGHFFLWKNVPSPPNNGAILNIAYIIKVVMSSAAKVELGALYINAWEAIFIRHILQELWYPQLWMPIQTDKSTAKGIINSKIQPKRTKAMDTRFHWLRNRERQDQFGFFWQLGAMNLADYWTKHHFSTHHKNLCPEFLTTVSNLMEARHINWMADKQHPSARVC